MTENLYHTDSYLRNFQAKVVSTDENTRAVVLDRTAFYPGGGGQMFDTGDLLIDQNTWIVEKTRKGEGGIEHILAGTNPLPESGMIVTGNLDWQRRYRMMRTHTAMHILCGVIFRDFNAQVTGGDMDLQQGRMDFEF